MFFSKKKTVKTYDKDKKRPVIRCSICTGEQVAGFKDIQTGAFEDVLCIKGDDDLSTFKSEYGIQGEIEKEY